MSESGKENVENNKIKIKEITTPGIAKVNSSLGRDVSQKVEEETLLPKELESSLEREMNRLKQQIREQTLKFAKETTGKKDDVSMRELSHAFDQLISGQERPVKFIYRVPPVTWISTVLALMFGILGVIAINVAPDGIQDNKGFLELGKGLVEIAKIFAGAIVGSATAAASMGNRG